MSRWGRSLLKRRKKLHKGFNVGNKGSAIVHVIIAMAMIGIFACTILWMAYLNYMIKLTDVKNKNSFYSAETVMEQIMAGVQHEASAAVSMGYQEVMKNWENYESEGEKLQEFSTVYLDTLIANLKDSSLGTNYYKGDVLLGFVDANLRAGMNQVTDSSNPLYADSWNNSTRRMELVNDSTLILKDIKVSYTDENGFLSIINTDICIDVPKLVFQHEGSIDGLYEYELIGNEGIETASGAGTSLIEGSIYAGVNDAGQGGLLINQGSGLTIENGRHVISGKDIALRGPQSGLLIRPVIGGDQSCVYATNLDVKSGILSIDGITYVADDLVLSGTGSKATLTREYYGYGSSVATGLIETDPVDPSKSSAIIINGSNATVDLSGLNRLMLAGRAYIGQSLSDNVPATPAPSPEATATPENRAIRMGESIAVKGNQIAYLVPAECIGTLDGKTVFGLNPLNGTNATKMSEYKEKYEESTGRFQEVDFNKKIYRLNGKSLSDFGVTDMKNIRKVYAQYNSSNPDDKTLLYYYLVLPEGKAEEYFAQYYNFNSNKDALDAYFKKYASGGILLGDYAAENTEYTILGNSLVSDVLAKNGVTLLTQQAAPTATPEGESATPSPGAEAEYQETGENTKSVTNEKDSAEVLALAAQYEQAYKSLNSTLTEDQFVEGQKVFGSIIKETGEGDDNLTTYLAANGGTVRFTSADGKFEAVLTNASDCTLSHLEQAGKKLRLIVSLGNVNVDKNFEGLIIAKGKITISGSVVLKRDKEGLYKVLSGTTGAEGDTTTPLQFFVNGGSVGAGATEAEVEKDGQLTIDFTEIVRYANWIKK